MERKQKCVNVVASGHTKINLSRNCLLQWINEILCMKVRKVEDLCSGVVYCQLMDILFPGCIPLHKIKLKANVMNEYWSNYKQLQIAFRSLGCEKDVPIDRIIEGRFQENFEFLQWFKRFFDANADYTESPKSNSAPRTSTPVASRKTARVVKEGARPVVKEGASPVVKDDARPVAIVNPVLSSGQLEKDLKSKIVKYQEKAETLTCERDGFFDKLRRIELLCTEDEAPKTKKKVLVEKILAALYAADEDEMPE